MLEHVKREILNISSKNRLKNKFSIQLAYSAGGLSVRIAEQTVDNQNYSTAAANQRDATTLSVALAF